MKIEYKIASITYNGLDKEGYYEERQTVNHIFVPSENPYFEEEEEGCPLGFEEPKIIPISLCHKYQSGIFADDDNDNSYTVDYYELERDFTKSKNVKMCKICTKKLRKLQAKKEKV